MVRNRIHSRLSVPGVSIDQYGQEGGMRAGRSQQHGSGIRRLTHLSHRSMGQGENQQRRAGAEV